MRTTRACVIIGRLAAGALTLSLLAGCTGSHEEAGKRADKAAGVKTSLFSEGPQQRLGALQDRADRDRAKAISAQAEVIEDEAKTVRAAADSQADALEKQARQIRAQAKAASTALDQQMDTPAGK